MRRLALIAAVMLALAAPKAAAQGNWASADYDFARYLVDSGLKQDARALLFRDAYVPSDTLTFLRGWTAYQLKELELADGLLRQVPRESPFFEESVFYSTVVSAYLGDYTGPAKRLLDNELQHTELRDMQLACLALMRDDAAAYRDAARSFAYDDYILQGPEKELDEIYHARFETPSKSPLLAAAASAVVPGLGKIYAGQVVEGIASFLVVGVLGAITAEHWVKDGPADWKTIVPGVLGVGFYIGNIYGSYVSVSIHNTRIRDVQDTAVMYNIHIPLRFVFK